MPGSRGLFPNSINSMRRNVKKLLIDTCDLYYPNSVKDKFGQEVINWVIVPGGEGIPFRIDVIQFRTQQLETYAEKQIMALLYKGYFMWNAPIAANQHLFHNGRWYQFRVINDDLSPDYLGNNTLSGGIYKVTHLASLD